MASDLAHDKLLQNKQIQATECEDKKEKVFRADGKGSHVSVFDSVS